MTQYYLRVTRGPLSRTEIVDGESTAFDRAMQLVDEGYDTVEVKTSEGVILRPWRRLLRCRN